VASIAGTVIAFLPPEQPKRTVDVQSVQANFPSLFSQKRRESIKLQ